MDSPCRLLPPTHFDTFPLLFHAVFYCDTSGVLFFPGFLVVRFLLNTNGVYTFLLLFHAVFYCDTSGVLLFPGPLVVRFLLNTNGVLQLFAGLFCRGASV